MTPMLVAPVLVAPLPVALVLKAPALIALSCMKQISWAFTLFCREFGSVVNRAFLVLIFWARNAAGATFFAFCNSDLELIDIEYDLENESQCTWHRQSSATGTHVGHHPRGWCNSYEDIDICTKIIQNFEFLTLLIWGLIFWCLRLSCSLLQKLTSVFESTWNRLEAPFPK